MAIEEHLKPNRTAWLVFALSACFLFYKYILQISPSVMTQDLMAAYHLSATALGFLVGFYFYTYLAMQIPSGILLDRFGARRFTVIAIFLCALGAVIFASTSVFWVACVGRLLIGFGAAFATTSYMKMASLWFPPQYFPLFTGLFGAACMTGAGTAGLPIAWMVNHIGWQGTILFCAGVGFVLVALFWSFVPEKRFEIAPGVAGDQFRFKDLWILCRNRSNWPLMFFGGLAFTPAAVFGGLWGVPYLMAAHGLDRESAATSASLVFFGFAAGGLAVGVLGRFFTRQRLTMIVGTSLSLFFLMVVLYVPGLSLTLLNSSIFLFGFCSGNFLLSYAIARNINSPAIVGTVIGVINMGDPLCGGIAEPLIGKILDLHWTGQMVNNVRVFSVHAYQLGLSILTLYLILALICCLLVKAK